MSLKIYLIAILALTGHFADSISQFPVILIISYDGFRYNYFDQGANPFLQKLWTAGTHTKHMNNAFITKTFPNHHTIATGLYPENHGILGNSVFDPKYGKKLEYSQEFWICNEDVLPVWIANQKKGGGRHSGIMMWPGNEYTYNGTFPTHHRSWQKNVTWEERVDGALRWIMDPERPANLVLLYIEEPDSHGHEYGPESLEHRKELQAMDNITLYLFKRLNETGLMNKINLFFLSDHGMLGVTKKDVIDLRQIVPSEKYDRYEGSPTFNIFPKKGEANFVYNALKNASASGAPFKVYKRDEIPERWHYKNNRRAPPILAVAEPPHVFHDFLDYVKYIESVRNFTATDDDAFGVHGYDNEVMPMKPYFFAMGPNIKKQHEIPPFETVDLFSLWAHMSGFEEYAAKTNGRLDRVIDMLANKRDDGSELGNMGGALLGIVFIALSVGISVLFIRRKLQYKDKAYAPRRLNEEHLESRRRLLDGVDTEEEA